VTCPCRAAVLSSNEAFSSGIPFLEIIASVFKEIVLRLSNVMAISMLNLELFERDNIERLIRDVKEEETIIILAQLMENQKRIFELQKQLLLLQKENAEKRRRK